MGNSWREKELSLREVIKKYSDISPFIIIKTDVQRRGIAFTDAALKKVNSAVHQVQYSECTRAQTGETPSSLIMRDGTTILTGYKSKNAAREEYLVDVVDGKIVLTDEGRVIEEVFYWEKPDYYDQFTSSGRPMWEVVSARPQRLDIYPHHYCEFWKYAGMGCKYCAAEAISRGMDEKNHSLTVRDILETVKEALKQPGRFANIFLTAGSVLSGKELLDDEVDLYIQILQEIGKLFCTERFPSQLLGTAYNKKQLKRIYDETGIMSYTADIEVLDAEKFKWICPGKEKWIGYDEWKNRLYEAVEIFGSGYVNTGIVGGVELATPYGFQTEDDALEHVLHEAELLARHGVSTVQSVWTVSEGSVFFQQTTPTLEYYIRLSKGLDDIRKKYHLNVDMDNYRRCGNHPDTDLSRVW